MPPFRRLATFASIGAAATIGYAVIAEGLAFFGLKPILASLIAYGVCACWSYLGHKKFTFGSPAPHHVEAPRFVVTTVAGVLVALGMPLLFARFIGPSPYFAVLATCILVPIISFIASQRFVFRPVGEMTSSTGSAAHGIDGER